MRVKQKHYHSAIPVLLKFSFLLHRKIKHLLLYLARSLQKNQRKESFMMTLRYGIDFKDIFLMLDIIAHVPLRYPLLYTFLKWSVHCTAPHLCTTLWLMLANSSLLISKSIFCGSRAIDLPCKNYTNVYGIISAK